MSFGTANELEERKSTTGECSQSNGTGRTRAHSTTQSRLRNALPAGHQLHWYEIIQVLGHGGFGVTYKARDTNLDQEVAIKEYFPSGFANRNKDGSVDAAAGGKGETFDWGLKRFLEEAQTLAKFRHPNLIRVLSVFEANGTAYMVMELVRGWTLREAITFKKIRDEATLLGILYPLLDGLEHIHAHGFIHRDIKPDNIMLREDATPVLLDFGSARRAIGAGDRQLTSVVSRGYTPFEQYDVGDGEVKQGPWSDIYGLGGSLYSVVTGESPADALNRGTALLEGKADPLKPTEPASGADFSQRLCCAIDRALAFKASARPQSVAEWRKLLPPPQNGQRVPSLVPSDPSAASAVASSGAGPAAGSAGIFTPPSMGASENLDISGLRFLLVDDESFVLNLTRRVLNKLGARDVAAISDGREALELIDHGDFVPDVILCDLNMPRMDGVEFIRHLGERKVTSAIVLVSGEDQRILQTAESLARSHDLYVLGAIKKPVRVQALEALLRPFDRSRTAVPVRHMEPITEDELTEGIEGDAVSLVFQPKVAVRSKQVIGVEALARWRHPTRGILGPGAFIPLAEESGRIHALTEAVFTKAMVQAGEWRAAGYDLSMAVNFCADSLRRLDLPEYLLRCAADEGVDPSRVTLEVTESRVMRDLRVSTEILTRLRMKGMGLSIDDFGTGHSSLEQLKRVPFTELKVDRAFVFGAAQDPSARAILESSITMGKSLGLNVVAEGAETQEDWDLVEKLGCDVVQGYFVSKPQPPEELPGWIDNWSR